MVMTGWGTCTVSFRAGWRTITSGCPCTTFTCGRQGDRHLTAFASEGACGRLRLGGGLLSGLGLCLLEQSTALCASASYATRRADSETGHRARCSRPGMRWPVTASAISSVEILVSCHFSVDGIESLR